jgi:hypothetical protein
MTAIIISKQTAKEMASRLREFLHAGGHDIKQTHTYEAVAKMFGYRNWNTLSAQLDQSPDSESTVDRNADELEIYWPWVGLARSRERRANGSLIHQPLTWQARSAGKPVTYHWLLPTMVNEPVSFELPIIGEPGRVDGEALLAIFTEAIANLIEVYTAKGLDGLSLGYENSRKIWSAEVQYHLRNGETFTFIIRARGSQDRATSQALLVSAADQVAEDLHAWGHPLLDRYRATGRRWDNLEQYGTWVNEVLHSARLVTP